jgi:hypothetical protein
MDSVTSNIRTKLADRAQATDFRHNSSLLRKALETWISSSTSSFHSPLLSEVEATNLQPLSPQGAGTHPISYQVRWG